MMPSSKLQNETRPGSSTMRFSGSRAPRTIFAGVERIASSTTCGGILTMRVSRSTRQAPSAKMSIASSSSTQTPVRSSTSRVARWMSSISASVNTLRLRPPPRRLPACRFRFMGLLPVNAEATAAGRARKGLAPPLANFEQRREPRHAADA